MAKESTALRVLIVEDELLIRWSIAETLAQSGHTVVEASSGATALQALREAAEPVDVVLLDLRLPDSQDLTLLEKVRNLTPSSSVVLMTAFGTPEVTSGALARGAYRVMNKPFDMDEIERVVRQANDSRVH